jgi:anti-sigma regulatory factor (Ser/Thr protein kinase)
MSATIDAPWRAREMVTATLVEAACTPECIETARLLVSEVVTNVVVHAQSTSVTVEVVVDEPWLRVCVRDEDLMALPRLNPPSPQALSGRGLTLVEQLSARWAAEVRTEPEGKVVWFEMVCA